MPRPKSLHDLLIEELQDLHHAETQLVQALPRLAESAASTELQEAFANHCEETKIHVARLEEILKDLREPAAGRVGGAMAGLIAESHARMDEDVEPAVKDAGLIAGAQRIEHYEIAGYGCARTFAELLGYDDAVELLQATLNEEREADEQLTAIAAELNVEARQSAD